MAWPLKSWAVNEVLGSSDLNNNFDALQTTYNALKLRADGRLTLTSGLPITTADVTAAGTLYYTPLTSGDLVALYDGSSMWNFYTLAEKSLSLSGYVKGALYDIFLSQSGGVLSLSSVVWKKVTATNSPTAGASKTINMADTGDLAVGRMVTVKDGTNSEIATVTAVVSNTSITVENLANAYTTPDIYGFNQRATALTTQNGILVKSGATTYRYIGTIRITDTAGQTEDSATRRYVWNYYNRVTRFMTCADSTDSWSYTTATWRAANTNVTDGAGRCSMVIGYVEDMLDATATAIAANNTGGVSFAPGIGINKTDTNSAQLYGGSGAIANAAKIHINALYKGYPPLGGSFIQRLEISEASGTTTWFGDNGSAVIKTGLLASVPM